jgi:hypothetical protein
MASLDCLAPCSEHVVEYDRQNLAMYAALIDASDTGEPWRVTAADLMKLDPGDVAAEACWRSHLKRARWIIGEGLETALVAFGNRAPLQK